ncbi:MAG TPA: UDP-glucose/GDP-mannose dehydrogenase family protein [Terriglobales bacterium]|nr:UDP-glucose/GDP-mannose dehydrogenase family protein [Terriglobales bacterium]
MQVTVVGSGYVGLVASACFAELGHWVICVDNDTAKVAALERGETPIHERFLPELLERHRGKRLKFTSSLSQAVQQSAVIFIAVGTPSTDNGDCDLSYVEVVAREISRSVSGYKLVVQKSTVPVCTSEWVRRIMVLNGAPENAFEVASNPEFLREGTAVSDFLFPDRIVIGANSKRAACLLQEIYRPLTDGSYTRRENAIPEPDQARIPARLIVTSTRSAELIKHASNAFLAMKISFINAVGNICEAVGANVEEVCDGIGSDPRIGDRFLSPGIGYGGSCFPKDLKAFRAVARESGYDFRLLDEVIRINEEQCLRFLRKVRSALWTLKGKRLAVLGLAFKGGTDDVRESPAITLVELLLREGCEVVAYDPAAMVKSREVLGNRVTFAESAYDAAEDADALLLLSDWEEFAVLSLPRLRRALKYPIVIDGRNLYDPQMMGENGFMYYSVGRPEAFPKENSEQMPQLRKAS